MPRTCSSCSLDAPVRQELDRRIRSGGTLPDIQRWLASKDVRLSINALTRHRQHTIPDRLPPGPRPRSASFLEAVESAAWDDMEAGVTRPSIRDGIAARGELNRQADRGQDRSLMHQIALALTGQSPMLQARVIDPEIEALEAEFRPYVLGPGELAPIPRQTAQDIRDEKRR